MSSLSKPKSTIFSNGVKLMLLATICFTIMQVFVKQLTSIHTFQITFFRAIITASLCSFYLWQHQISFKGNNQKILFIRAILGIISMTSFFFTLKWMPFGAAVSLKYLSPIFAAVAAIFLVKEKIHLPQWLFFGMAFLGVLFLKGFDSRINFWGLSIGVFGAIAGGLIYPLIRKIGQSEHPMVIINYFMLTASFVIGGLMLPYWKNPSITEWVYVAIMGISGYFAQVLLTKAFQIEEVNLIAPIKYLEVVYALLIGLIWYGESYAFLSFSGILLILLGMFLNVRYKNKIIAN